MESLIINETELGVARSKAYRTLRTRIDTVRAALRKTAHAHVSDTPTADLLVGTLMRYVSAVEATSSRFGRECAGDDPSFLNAKSFSIGAKLVLEDLVRSDLNEGDLGPSAENFFRGVGIAFAAAPMTVLRDTLDAYETGIAANARIHDVFVLSRQFYEWVDAQATSVMNASPFESLRLRYERLPITIDGYTFRGRQVPTVRRDEGAALTFEDIAGLEEPKRYFQDLARLFVGGNVEEAIRKAGSARDIIPRFVLLVGPTGSGKTLLANAFAYESRLPMERLDIGRDGSTYVNGLATNIHKKIELAARYVRSGSSPASILFMDEMDAISSSRGGGQNREDDKAVNTLLADLTDNANYSRIICIGTSNRLDIIDGALLSGHRLDRAYELPYPDLKVKAEIYRKQVELRSRAGAEPGLFGAIDYATLAKESGGLSGADIANVVGTAVGDAIKTSYLSGSALEPVTTAAIMQRIAAYNERIAILSARKDYLR
ncbi:ATP-binding protein [Candidatus Woesearchaeota archaeon]|nr:ATP-binding protein [Candidatus Woesearchaeota archaeon]